MSATEHANGEVIESTAVDVTHPPAVIPPVPPRLDVVPTVVAGDLVKRLEVIRQAQSSAMVPNVDYGVIPGTDKPTLLKPGAEKLGVLFQLDVQLVNEKVFGPGDHLTVISHATVFHAPTGARLGYGEGVCTTREKKYAYRTQERMCPHCEKASVIKGKAEYGGGWLCWKKRDGCGATWQDGDPAIEGQPAGQVENPDLPDLWNTVVKMGEKRARVDAVLAVTGASALFTQDIEDAPSQSQGPAAPPVQQQPRPVDGQGGQRPEPSATVKPNERPVSAGQKRMLNARAAGKDADGKQTAEALAPSEFCDVIMRASDSEPRDYENQDAAQAHLNRLLDRLPMRMVDGVLAGIAEMQKAKAAS